MADLTATKLAQCSSFCWWLFVVDTSFSIEEESFEPTYASDIAMFCLLTSIDKRSNVCGFEIEVV
jgi:hypothetical protein